MEQPLSRYLLVILVLAIILFIVGSYAYQGFKAEEGFTALAFVQGKTLPETVENGKAYPFAFEIQNRQDLGQRYAYRVIADGALIDEDTLLVPAGSTTRVESSLLLQGKASGKDIQVAVQLPELNQQIQQWVSVR